MGSDKAVGAFASDDQFYLEEVAQDEKPDLSEVMI